MNRRDLLRNFAGAGIAARLARAARLTRDNVCFITDEVSRDLSVALQFAAEFGVRQVEFRNVYGMYCFRHDNEKLKQIHAQLKEHGVRLAILDTPVLKCVLPGSQLLKSVEKPIQDAQKDLPVPVEEQFAQQAEYTRKAIEAARILETDKIRIFSYWRVADREKERPRILEGLQRVTEIAEKAKVKLCIENEGACNIADCAEAASVMKEIRSPYLGVNWDIVNGSSTGETPFPDGFNKLDKNRIWHVHVKDMLADPETKRRRVCAVGDGTIPYHDILPALAKAGYTGALSMETHFSINGSREPASRRSMQGLLKVISELA
jgi:sugar phosphate isomerase/epimerase